MTSFIIVIVGLYVTYYLGNIIYDLFLKKEKENVENETTEEFLLNDFAEENEDVETVLVDDVEELRKEISQDEYVVDENIENENVSIEDLEYKYNEENLLDKNKVNNNSLREESKNRFKEMMKLAETSVQLVGSIDGQKVYQSALQF